jgi:hypothetical protein
MRKKFINSDKTIGRKLRSFIEKIVLELNLEN